MLNLVRSLLGIALAAAAAVAQARDVRGAESLDLKTPRFFITLVPQRANIDLVPGFGETPSAIPALKLTAPRRSRLEFAIQQRDVFASGDQLQLRLASDAHVVAQLLSGGKFSGADEEGMLAMLGAASRLRLSYSLGPWSLALGATRKLGAGEVNARIAFSVRF
jgi:hypothetical protein